MTILNWLFMTWAAITVALVFVLIYRSTVSMKEDDQLFLDPAEHQLEEEQRKIRLSLDRLRPAIQALSVGSGTLAVAMIGIALYTAL
jgi:hypothetical protein